MSEKFRLYRKIGFQNAFYTKCLNVIIDSIGPSIILRSIYVAQLMPCVVKHMRGSRGGDRWSGPLPPGKSHGYTVP